MVFVLSSIFLVRTPDLLKLTVLGDLTLEASRTKRESVLSMASFRDGEASEQNKRSAFVSAEYDAGNQPVR